MTSFQHIRLVLAREPGHPDGDQQDGYDLVAPFDDSGRLDVAACRVHKDHLRVRRFHEGDTIAVGGLRRGPGGDWLLDFNDLPGDPDTGLRFGEERFVLGEYVSIRAADNENHTYVVAQVEDLSAKIPL